MESGGMAVVVKGGPSLMRQVIFLLHRDFPIFGHTDAMWAKSSNKGTTILLEVHLHASFQDITRLGSMSIIIATSDNNR